MEKLFAYHDKIEVKDPAIRKMTVEGVKAKLRVEVEMTAIAYCSSGRNDDQR